MDDSDKYVVLARLQQIKNIGPKMAIKLYDAGIYDFKTLVTLGAEDAYIMVDESGGFCGTHHAAYLYALEAAIIGCQWYDVPEPRKLELKAFAQSLRDTIEH